MKYSFSKILCAFFITTGLLACSNDESKKGNGAEINPRNVTTGHLVGAWQVDGYLINGNPATPRSDEFAETIQYDISDTQIRVIMSQNNQVTWETTAAYKIENGRVVTLDSQQSAVHDFDIVALTSTTMRVRPIPQEGQGDMNWTLRRIDPSTLAGGPVGTPGSPRLEQVINITAKSRSFQFTKSYGNSSVSSTNDLDFSCDYARNKGVFRLNFAAYRPGSRQRTERDIESDLSIIGRDVHFDERLRSELKNFEVRPPGEGRRPGFVATFTPRQGRKIYFGMAYRSHCQFSLRRNGDVVEFEGLCRNLAAYGEKMEKHGEVFISGACALQ